MEIAFREIWKKKSMCILITAIHYSNKSGAQPLIGYKFQDRDVCKRQTLHSDRVNLQIKGCMSLCLVDSPPGKGELGSIPGWGSELLPLNTKAGHVTVTYQQWQESSCLGFLRPCFSEPSLFYN